MSTVSTVSIVIARCYLHLRWYFFNLQRKKIYLSGTYLRSGSKFLAFLISPISDLLQISSGLGLSIRKFWKLEIWTPTKERQATQTNYFNTPVHATLPHTPPLQVVSQWSSFCFQFLWERSLTQRPASSPSLNPKTLPKDPTCSSKHRNTTFTYFRRTLQCQKRTCTW